MDSEARIRAYMPRRVNAYSLMLVPLLLGDGRWKTTSDLLDLDEHGRGVGYGANDGFDSSRVGQGKNNEQDTDTKINPECGLLDLTDICALAKLMQGPG